MDSGSKRKHRGRKRRINIEPVSKAPKAAEATSTAADDADKDKREPAPTEEAETLPSRGASSSPKQSGASSPEPNCAICLGKLENRSFTDSCFHTFCFVCLVEWSKVKPECPLCKQSFKSIYHNVRSNDDYDQYPVQRPEDQNPLGQMRHLMEGVRFRYRTTVTDHRYAHIAERIDQEIHNRLLQRPSNRIPIPNWRRIRQPANSEFRRSVYLQHLEQKSESMNTRRRVRETSPSFFRENPAQTHRLVPWLNRELNALLQGHGQQIGFVLDLIVDLVKRYAINSEEFYQHVYPFIGRNTRQFMKEFLLFAKSPYHMPAYDRHVTYEASQDPHHDSESDSDHNAPGATDDGNDSDVVVVSPDNTPPSRPHPGAAPPRLDSSLDPWERSIMTVGNPSYLGFPPIVRSYGQENLTQGHDALRNPYYSFGLPPSASGWDSPTPGPSSILDDMNLLAPSSSQLQLGASSSIWTPSASSYSAPITPLQTRTDSSDNLLDPLNLQRTSHMSNLVHTNNHGDPIVCNESCTDSDDGGNTDDVMIVDYEKPWTERSPIQLSSAVEDTDSDICITGMSYAADSVKKERKKKHKHKKREHRDKDRSKHHEGSRKRQAEDSTEASKTKKRRQSRSKSRSVPRTHYEDKSRSRSPSPSHDTLFPVSPSRSPIRMRLYKPPHYSHKKFGYDRQAIRDESRQQGSHRSVSSAGSRHSHRGRSSSGTLTDSDPGSESRHVTYTSHKKRDKGRHASIEILEYRKKSSKHKKSKKHKKDKKKTATVTGNALHESDEELSERNKERATDSSSTHKYKRSKAKKKKSKHKSHKHKENRHDNHTDSQAERKTPDSTPERSVDAESDERRMSADVSQQVARIFKEIAEIKQQSVQNTQHFTSDSETDSDVDVENVAEKRKTPVPETQSRKQRVESQDSQDATRVSMPLEKDASSVCVDNTKDSVDASDSNTVLFPATGFEFVELPTDQAASVDLELATITKSLDENVDSETEDGSRPKQFKKHPFGHKKSGKHSTEPVSTFHGTNLSHGISALTAAQASSPGGKRTSCILEDNIQSHDISSCTDFESSSNLRIDNLAKESSLNIQQDATINGIEGVNRTKRPSHLINDFGKELCSYESPTSSAYISPPNEARTENDIVNVETLSDGSDVDIVGDNIVDNFLAIPSYRTSRASLKLLGSHDNIAVDLKSSEQSRFERELDREIQEEIDVTGVSDTDSVVECVGEEQRRITIATDSSDSDSNSYIEVLNHDSDHYIDVLGNTDEDDDNEDDDVVIGEEETVINQFPNRRELTIDTDLESTDLDYHFDTDDNNIGVEDRGTSSLNNILHVLSDRDSENTDLDYSLEETDNSESHDCLQTSRSNGLSSDQGQSSGEASSMRKKSHGSSSTTGKDSSRDRLNMDVGQQSNTTSSDSPCLLASTALASASSAVHSYSSIGPTSLETQPSPNNARSSAEEMSLTSDSSLFPHTAKSPDISGSTGKTASLYETNSDEHKSELNKPQIADAKSPSNEIDSDASASIPGQPASDSNANNNNSTFSQITTGSNANNNSTFSQITTGSNANNNSTLSQITTGSGANNINNSTATDTSAMRDTTSRTSTSLPVSSGLIWSANPLFEPRNPLFSSNLTTGHSDNAGPDYISSVFEPSSPLFQPSPDYGYDEFSPAVSDSSDDNFVPED